MGSQCYLPPDTDTVIAPAYNPSQKGKYSTNLLQRDGRLSWPSRLDDTGWLHTQMVYLPTYSSPIQVLTGPGVE